MKNANFKDVDGALQTCLGAGSRAGTPQLKCSNRWLSQFNLRKMSGFCNIKGEAKVVKPEAMDVWKNTLLPKLLDEYSPNDINNADETGIFYKLETNKSLVFRDKDGRGGKCSKPRITVMPVANMSGTHKLTPLVINNCWKHIF